MVSSNLYDATYVGACLLSQRFAVVSSSKEHLRTASFVLYKEVVLFGKLTMH